jgi:tetratricopeptide (TPR) repeat protein
MGAAMTSRSSAGAWVTVFSLVFLAWTAPSPAQSPPRYIELTNEVLKLFGQGRFVEARQLAEKAVEAAEQAVGPKHPHLGITLHNLAETYRREAASAMDEAARLRAATAAASLHERALAIKEAAIGVRSSSTLDSMVGLADDYRILRRYDEAEAQYRRAIAIIEEIGSRAPILGMLWQRASIGLDRIEKERKGPGAPLVAHAPPAPSDRAYTSAAHRWSISYPADWTVDDKDPAFVRFSSAADNALCGVHARAVRFAVLDEFTDFILGQVEQFLRQKGLVSVVRARRQSSLPGNIVGNDVLVDLLPGLRSRRFIALADGVGYVIDCETYAQNWKKLEPLFERVISSFTLRE